MIELKNNPAGNFFLLAGPCVIEGEEMAMRIAERVVKITETLQIPYVFKGSYRKANRSRLGFHFIVIDRSSAMCIDKTDIFGSYSGFFHSLTDGESQAVTGSGRTGDVIGIVADSPPRKQYILCTACRTQ